MSQIVIDRQLINVSEEEEKLYNKLLLEFGKGAFEKIVKTDENNDISLIDISKKESDQEDKLEEAINKWRTS